MLIKISHQMGMKSIKNGLQQNFIAMVFTLYDYVICKAPTQSQFATILVWFNKMALYILSVIIQVKIIIIVCSNHPNKTLDQSMAEAEIDTSRIIDPSLGITNEALYQYLPATKLKGMDDWVPESQHYSYYSSMYYSCSLQFLLFVENVNFEDMLMFVGVSVVKAHLQILEHCDDLPS